MLLLYEKETEMTQALSPTENIVQELPKNGSYVLERRAILNHFYKNTRDNNARIKIAFLWVRGEQAFFRVNWWIGESREIDNFVDSRFVAVQKVSEKEFVVEDRTAKSKKKDIVELFQEVAELRT